MLDSVYKITDLYVQYNIGDNVQDNYNWDKHVNCLADITITPIVEQIPVNFMFSTGVDEPIVRGYDIVISGHFGDTFEEVFNRASRHNTAIGTFGTNYDKITRLTFVAENIDGTKNNIIIDDFTVTNPYDLHLSNDIEEVMEREVTLYAKNIKFE